MKIIMIAFSIYFIYSTLKNVEKAFWLALFIIMAIPFSRYNKLIEYIEVIPIGGFSINIIHVLLISLLLSVVFCKDGVRIIKSINMRLVILLLFTYICAIVIGLINGYDAMGDAQKYILQIIWLIVLIYYSKKFITINKLLEVTSKALSINFMLIILMNIFKSKLIFMLAGEYFESGNGLIDSYASYLAIFPIAFCIYDFICRRNIRKNLSIYICSVISIIYILMFQSSRSIILVLVIIAVLISFVSLRNSNRNSFISKLTIISVISFFGILIGIIYMQSDNEIVERLMNMNIFSTEDTLLTRIKTIEYYYGEIKNNIFGYGFGKLIPLINQYGRFHGEGGFYTDNALINVSMKCGIFSLGIYILLLLKPIRNQFLYYKNFRNNFALVQIIAYVGFLFLSVILTSQINHNYVIMIGGWAFAMAILDNNIATKS